MTHRELAEPASPGVDRERALSTFTVIAFTALYMMMTVDRQIVSLTLESIKKDLLLSDTVMALIAGFGFSLFHTLLGFPAARWGDRGDRRTIIAIAVALWSGMTLVCGFVTNAIQLALARIGVGVGESSLPILHSILADSSTNETRGRVMSMFVLGSPLAALLACPVGSIITSVGGPPSLSPAYLGSSSDSRSMSSIAIARALPTGC